MVYSIARVSALWRQGWIEIPEIMATSGLAIVGMGISGIVWVLGEKRGSWNRKYKSKPMVIRSDDPRVPHIRHSCGLDD